MPRIAQRPRAARLEPLAAKVPEITVMFWVLKLVTTGMGEAMSDFLGETSIPLAVVVGGGGMWLALRLQTRAREYQAWRYWLAVMMVAIFGTMIADGIHDGASISYAVTTPLFAAIVAIVFIRWHRAEGTLSIHSITTRRRERFYWSAVFGTFALGTAAGDLTAALLGLGYLNSIFLFAILISIPALAWSRFRLHPIIAFWSAYVLTRPLGASFADWFSKAPGETGSGLHLGDGPVSAVALVIFLILVWITHATKHDVQRGEHGHPEPEGPHPHWDASLELEVFEPEPTEG
jgi:uncharacterized membrane-anchored protein